MKKKLRGKDFITRDYEHIIIRRQDKMEALSMDIENTELNVTVAMELYKKGEVSLSKAAEIAGMTTIEFKEILGRWGFTREIEARPAEEMDKKLKKYL